MYSLPAATELNPKKVITKKSLYEKFLIKGSEKKILDENIEKMNISFAISTSTIPSLEEGEKVKCIYVLEINVKKYKFNFDIINLLSKYIKQKLVFVVIYDNNCMLCVYRGGKVIHKDWILQDKLSIQILGSNLDIIYENIIYYAAHLERKENLSLDEHLDLSNKMKLIQDKINVLENKLNKTKQSKEKLKFFEEIKDQEKELAVLINKTK